MSARKDPPPPGADAPSMSIFDKTKTPAVTRIPEVDKTKAPAVTRLPEVDKTKTPAVTRLPEVDKTKGPAVTRISEVDKTKYDKNKTEKIKTEKSKSEKSRLDSKYETSKQPKLPPSSTYKTADGGIAYNTSAAPPTMTKLPLTDDYNNKMRARQTKYHSLIPKEQEEQEAWAQARLQQVGNCPKGYLWFRWKDGYRCHGGDHRVTDKLLAQGEGKSCRMLLRLNRMGSGPRIYNDETWSEPLEKEDISMSYDFGNYNMVAPGVTTQYTIGREPFYNLNMVANIQAMLEQAKNGKLMNPNSAPGYGQGGPTHVINRGNAFNWETVAMPSVDSSKRPSGSNIVTLPPSSSSSSRKGSSKSSSQLKKPKDEDEKMREKQRRYISLTPQEKVEQDKWVEKQLTSNQALGRCTKGYDWVRVGDTDRYQCYGGKGAHVVTDELLAEGLGGFYEQDDWNNLRGYWPHGFQGPRYPRKDGSTRSYPRGHKNTTAAGGTRLDDAKMTTRQTRYSTMTAKE